MPSNLLTVTQAAERRTCSRQWIHYLIKKGRLKAEEVGGIFILREKDVDACEVPGPGRPKNTNGKKAHESPTAKRGSKKKRVARRTTGSV